MDKRQRIEFEKKCNAMGQLVDYNEKAYYAWERAVYGGSSLPPWINIQEENIYTLKYVRRFGPIMVEFLRFTSAQDYWGDTPSILSPKEPDAQGDFTDE